MTSPSTVFLGHPSETMETFARSVLASASPPDGGCEIAARVVNLAAAENECRRALAVDVATEAPDRAARLPRSEAADMLVLDSRVTLEGWTAREGPARFTHCLNDVSTQKHQKGPVKCALWLILT